MDNLAQFETDLWEAADNLRANRRNARAAEAQGGAQPDTTQQQTRQPAQQRRQR